MQYGLNKISDIKIAYIGGGSRGWAWTFMNDLALEERLEGSLATTAWGIMHGASFVRVHDVKEHRRLLDMMEAIRDSQ